MLAVKSSSGHSDYIGNADGIPSWQLFDFIIRNAEACAKDAIHVIYGGGYDFNMMLRDVPRETVDRLYHGEFVTWRGFRLHWRPGKSYYVCRVNANGDKLSRGVTTYDVVSFFQCPFVKACDDYLGERFYRRDIVVENKALRSSFTAEDIPAVAEYNDAELVNLLELMGELRSRLNRVGLRPRRWDGPGAVASALMLREDVKAKRAPCPADVARAGRFAYAGGRFEVLRFGHYDGPVYEYDVNSAYPAALRNVPDLATGRWEHVLGDPGPQPFAVYHVEYSGEDASIPGPFFRRSGDGTISYPLDVTGWYWSPEVETARAYCRTVPGASMRILEAHVYHERPGSERPFHFIDALYDKRRALKKAKDGAHVGVKLGLNSLYGKLAQQVGARQDDNGAWRTPPFHQLEWAGYTTSYCRAAVLSAVLPNLRSVIAFETDAVFVTEPLTVPEGEALGEFERVAFDDLTYVQSGMYFGMSDGKMVEKTRGVDRGQLTRESVLARMSGPEGTRNVDATLTRFVGAGIALAQSWDRWRRWERMTKNMTLEPQGKRVHSDECGCGGPELSPGLHDTYCPVLDGGHSAEFPIAWINPDPSMSELSELREAERIDYE